MRRDQLLVHVARMRGGVADAQQTIDRVGEMAHQPSQPPLAQRDVLQRYRNPLRLTQPIEFVVSAGELRERRLEAGFVEPRKTDVVDLQGAVVELAARRMELRKLRKKTARALQERMHTRDMAAMGGLWETVPRLAGFAMLFAVASLGLPGLGDFVGEFLVLLGSWRASVAWTVVAALGLVGAVAYALILVQRTFHGENRGGWRLSDCSAREGLALAAMAAVAIWLGIYPQPVLDTAKPAMALVQSFSAPLREAAR